MDLCYQMKKKVKYVHNQNIKYRISHTVKSSCPKFSLPGGELLSLVELNHQSTRFKTDNKYKINGELCCILEIFWLFLLLIFDVSVKEFSFVPACIFNKYFCPPTRLLRIRPNQDLVVHICLFLPSLLSLSLRD